MPWHNSAKSTQLVCLTLEGHCPMGIPMARQHALYLAHSASCILCKFGSGKHHPAVLAKQGRISFSLEDVNLLGFKEKPCQAESLLHAE